MPSPNNPLRRIARGAKMRDWSEIDKALDDLMLEGRDSIMLGYRDARRLKGEEPASLPELDAPDPVTIHDLPSREGITIEEDRGYRIWKKSKAA